MAKTPSKWNSLHKSKLEEKVELYRDTVASMSKVKQAKLLHMWSLMQEFGQDHVIAKAISGVIHGSTISQGRKAERILKKYLSKCKSVNSVEVDVPIEGKNRKSKIDVWIDHDKIGKIYMELKDGGVNNTHSPTSKAQDIADRVEASGADRMILACTRPDIISYFSKMTAMITSITMIPASTLLISGPKWMLLFPDFDTNGFFEEIEKMRISSTGGYIDGHIEALENLIENDT